VFVLVGSSSYDLDLNQHLGGINTRTRSWNLAFVRIEIETEILKKQS
jgi:hypothetical protein